MRGTLAGLGEIRMKHRKTPQEKKDESYKHDRINRYGENSKSSRKNIARHRARTHREYRRSVKQVLQLPTPGVPAEHAENADIAVKTVRRDSFKKTPDEPLGKVVREKLERRSQIEKKSRTRSG